MDKAVEALREHLSELEYQYEKALQSEGGGSDSLQRGYD